ncbi:hypothetical protein VE03_03630 [Pseudogymnoascus sp. 23342-1-I1]|nr:hypothetical protein VE03_03623 [Pseudogymnoascus sp. 23342-1-I1]OBT66563.1 hypothetical protein VE03_03630 [Pseudogymnoascus sp. 23342-1-I1]
MAATASSRSPSPTPSKLPPVPVSPTYSYASTANPISAYNLPAPPPPQRHHAVLTKNDLELSQTAYSELLTTAKQYRHALAELSKCASQFGSALESCARLKEARSETLHINGGSLGNSITAQGTCTADNLMAASGIHQLVANHQQILSETVYRSFEVPLLHELDGWRRSMEEEELAYQREVKERSREIRRMEKEGLKLHKQRKRDVARFRGHLVDLTTRLDELTAVHAGHSRALLRDSQEASVKIVEASSSLVRAEVDIYESLARKGWSGGGLDELLDKGVDLFANDLDGTQGDGTKLFSILPQKSILAEANADRPHHRRGDSMLVEGEHYQSLTGAVTGDRDEVASIFSQRTTTESHFNKSRGVRPFSPPPPVRRLGAQEEGARTPLMEEEEGTPEGGENPIAASEGETEEEEDDSATIRKERGRERSWSVTDDGVLSE